MTQPLLALQAVDAVALVLLAAFTAWGALRGALRQILSLVLLVGAFPVAAHYGPRIEDTVVKAVSATGSDVPAIAWLAVFAGVLIAGGVLLALLQPLLRRVRLGGRLVGALLGVVHGTVVLTVLAYGLLASFHGEGRPGWIRGLERSVAARAIGFVGEGLGSVVDLPPWLEQRVEEVNTRVES